MLNNFFKINMPYGLARNNKGEWMCFNREYMPLGYNNQSYKEHPGHSYTDKPIYTKFNGLTDRFIEKIATSVIENDKGEIVKIFLYDDATNPVSNVLYKKGLWDLYFDKIKLLSKLKRPSFYDEHTARIKTATCATSQAKSGLNPPHGLDI